MALSRNQNQVIAMTVIYNELIDFNFGDNSFIRNVDELIKGMTPEGEEIDTFTRDLVITSLNKYSEIVNAFLPYLRNWKWERLPLLTQAILLMSYTHYYYVGKANKKIVINIAVDLAKKYVDDKQGKFVNAILDSGVLA